MRRSHLYWALALSAVLLAGCRIRSREAHMATPEQLVAALRDAARAGDGAAVYDLLDQQTQWSIMTLLRDQRRLRDLVRKHYSPQRRGRELRRTALAGTTDDPRAFFAQLARAEGLLAPLAKLGAIEGRRHDGAAVVLLSAGQEIPVVRRDDGWAYRGWRDRFERLKVRASRDLDTVEASIASGGGRR